MLPYPVRDDQLMSGVADTLAPESGFVVILRLDQHEEALYWGEDPSGNDRFATVGGTLARWQTTTSLEEDAVAYGWTLEGVTAADSPQVVDVDRVRGWAAGTRALSPTDALALWNLATDVAYSLGLTFRDRGHLANRCYDKLFASNLPWTMGQESYTPRWTVQELRVLRRVLNSAIHVVRQGLEPRRT